MKTKKFHTIIFSLLCCFSFITNIANAQLPKEADKIRNHLEFLGYSTKIDTKTDSILVEKSDIIPFRIIKSGDNGFIFVLLMPISNKNNFDINFYKKLNQANLQNRNKVFLQTKNSESAITIMSYHNEYYNKDTFKNLVDLYNVNVMTNMLILSNYLLKE